MAIKAENPATMLPLWDVIDDTIVTTHGVYLRVARLRGIDARNISAGDIESIAKQLYNELIDTLPEQLYLQIIVDSHSDYGDIFERYKKIPEPKNPILALQRRRRLEFIKESNLRRHKLHIVFGYMKGFKRSEFQRINKKTNGKKIEELDELGKKVEAALSNAGVNVYKVDRNQVFDLFWELLNPEIKRTKFENQKTSAPRNKVQIKVLTPREYLFSTGNWEWNPEYLKIGNRYYKVLTLVDLPDETTFAAMENIYDLDFNYRLTMYLHIPAQKLEQESLDQQRRFMTSMSKRKRNIRDYKAEKKFEESEGLAKALAKTGQRQIKFGSHMIIWASTKRELEKRARQTSDYFRSKIRMSYFEENNAHDQYFFKSFPGMAINSKRHLLMLSNNAVDLLPLYQEKHGDVDPVMLVKTPRDELFSFNPFEESRDNWNATVFGSPGSGKSVTMNMLITNAILQSSFSGRVIVVDFAGEKESSYLMVAKLFGGEFVPVLASGQYAINPFPEPKRALDEYGKLTDSTEAFLVTLTDILLSNTGTDKEAQLFRVIIQRGIRETYSRCSGQAPIYSDLLETVKSFVDDKEVDQKRLSDVIDLLKGFVDSPASKLFNKRSSVKITSDFIVLDLFGIDALNPNIAEAVVFMTTQWVKEIAFDPEYRNYTYVILDEVAQLMKRPEMIETIEELLATSRKHLTSVWLVTQNFATYANSPLVDVVVLNTTTQIFLSHGSAVKTRKLIAEAHDFSERELELFGELRTVKGPGGYSLALIRTSVWNPDKGEKEFISSTIKIDLSPLDLEICTSDAKDREIQERLIKRYQGKPLEEILHFIAYEWKPSQKKRGVA